MFQLLEKKQRRTKATTALALSLGFAMPQEFLLNLKVLEGQS
jgi:hypothetical protein